MTRYKIVKIDSGVTTVVSTHTLKKDTVKALRDLRKRYSERNWWVSTIYTTNKSGWGKLNSMPWFSTNFTNEAADIIFQIVSLAR